jgi:integrase
VFLIAKSREIGNGKLGTLSGMLHGANLYVNYVFPSPRKPGKPIGSVKRAWRTALTKAGVPYFPIYNLRHVFCTRLSWVAPDAVLQRAMRHSSPETKRHYQLGMVNEVRKGIEQANERAYQGKQKVLRFYYGRNKLEKGAADISVTG